MQQPNDEATTEQRARAVQYWTDVVRPQMAAKDDAKKPKETPEQALERLQAKATQPVTIGPSLAKILSSMRKGGAA